MSKPITIAILTVSDRCSQGMTGDTTGPALVDLAQEHLAATTIATACVPDELDQISHQIRKWATQSPHPDIIITTGGTGLAPRDVTPEATLAVLDRRHSGLMELARSRCGEITSRAYLSRGEAGVINRSLVINLPGSLRGATENLQALCDILPHAVETLRGEVQDDGRPDAKETTGKVVRHDD